MFRPLPPGVSRCRVAVYLSFAAIYLIAVGVFIRVGNINAAMGWFEASIAVLAYTAVLATPPQVVVSTVIATPAFRMVLITVFAGSLAAAITMAVTAAKGSEPLSDTSDWMAVTSFLMAAKWFVALPYKLWRLGRFVRGETLPACC